MRVLMDGAVIHPLRVMVEEPFQRIAGAADFHTNEGIRLSGNGGVGGIDRSPRGNKKPTVAIGRPHDLSIKRKTPFAAVSRLQAPARFHIDPDAGDLHLLLGSGRASRRDRIFSVR